MESKIPLVSLQCHKAAVSLFRVAVLNSREAILSCVLTTAAVHGCCITAHLYEEQISIGVIAVASRLLRPCCAEQHRTAGKLFCPNQC